MAFFCEEICLRQDWYPINPTTKKTIVNIADNCKSLYSNKGTPNIFEALSHSQLSNFR
jgi:hypothetical protein